MRYLAAICVVLFCCLGSTMSHAPSICVECDSIPSDSLKKAIKEETKGIVKNALDSLKVRFDEVKTKHDILVLKTAMLERKMSKEYIGHVDSFRTLTGWWIVQWWYINGKYSHRKDIYDNSLRNRNSSNSSKIYWAN